MNESSAYDSQASAVQRSKGLNIALWCVQVLLALAFLGASSGKLLGKPEMIALFDAIGVGQWFRFVTGLLELAGAALILVPKTRSIGAGVLAGVMVGAIATHLFVLHNAPTAPLVLVLLASFVLWGRRQELMQLVRPPSGASEQKGTSR